MTAHLVLEALLLSLRLRERTYAAIMASAPVDEVQRLAALTDKATARWRRRESQLYAEAGMTPPGTMRSDGNG